MVNYFQSYVDNEYSERRSSLSIAAQLRRWDRLQRMKWVLFDGGELPSQAVECGQKGKHKLYLARAAHEGSCTPGYLDTSDNCCYIPWGGQTHKKQWCEVLCTPGNFVPCTSTNNLLRATPAGLSEEGEPLYIGKVEHKGKFIPGKVQRSHQVCYIPLDGKEYNFKEYDIFIRSPIDADSTDNAPRWIPGTDGEISPSTSVTESTDENLYDGHPRRARGFIQRMHEAMQWRRFYHLD